MSPRILFIANGGAEIGGGHVLRSLTLAQALAARGAAPTFLASPPVAALLDAFGPEIARAPVAALDPASIRAAVANLAYDAVVFDHYGLAAPDHAAVARGRTALVIDDLADRPLAADMVVDAGPHRMPADYALFAPGAQLLLGPAYAPIRPAFAQARAMALARRAAAPERILVALGLTDLGAITAAVVPLIRRRTRLSLDVVLGAGAPSLETLRPLAAADPSLALHVDTREMAALTAQADIGIGAAGSSTWERCVLGLPSMLLLLAPNQHVIAGAMAEHGAGLALDASAPDFAAAFDHHLRRLLEDSALRARLSRASSALCDGQGAPRVAAALLARLGRGSVTP